MNEENETLIMFYDPEVGWQTVALDKKELYPVVADEVAEEEHQAMFA